MSFHNTWCEISGRALATNVEILRRRLHPDAALGVVVKSGAYGHGIACCVPVFLRAGVDWLIVNDVAEAAHVRSLTEDTPIYICSPVPEALAGAAVAARARVVVTAPEGVLSLARAGRAEGWEVPVHLKAETGCHRLGVDMAGLLQLAELVTRTEGVRLEGVATHFADIEDTTNHTYAREQLQSLESAAQSLRDKGHTLPMVHAANSAATILWPEAHHQLVRVGIAAYGLWPSRETYATALQAADGTTSAFIPELRPALTWRARVSQVKSVPAGSFVGYGRTYRTTGPSRIAVLPVGYYEGLKRDVSNLAHVLINGQRAPVRGRVCMNMTMVDVTHIPDVEIGTVATLIGEDGGEEVSADLMASWAGTIHYEIVSSIQPAIPRILGDE